MRLWPKRQPQAEAERALTFEEWQSYFSFNGVQYALAGLNQTQPGRSQETIGAEFQSLATLAYMSNPIVATCIDVRMLMFSEARFMWRQLRSGRPGDMFSSPDLDLLRTPWPGGTTADLLSRALQDVDLAGNFFACKRPGRIKRLRPDWVTIVLGSTTDPDTQAGDVDAEAIGYVYQPGGPGSGRPPEVFLRDEVCHFVWKPDPLATFRGMSWITPVIREVMADKAATDSKTGYWENGATPNLLIKFDRGMQQAAFDAWVAKFKAGHEGAANAHKTLFLGGGADATPIGANLGSAQADLKAIQGAGETRIANAAQVPAVIGGFSEGLQGSSLNAGNYEAAKARFVDITMRPLWRNFAGSMANIMPPPSGAELWYDDRDIPALRENVADAAAVQLSQAQAITTLVKDGFDPDSARDAIVAGDLKLLKHTGLASVQLQKPGAPNGATNGATPAPPQTLRALAEQLLDHVNEDGEDA